MPGNSNNPLEGVTLENVVRRLSGFYGWEELGRRVPIRCFQVDPSVGSSLKFLRRTPWARTKVEALYVATVRQWPEIAEPDEPGSSG
jgi:uncharacterized protein (DUF2132 family)